MLDRRLFLLGGLALGACGPNGGSPAGISDVKLRAGTYRGSYDTWEKLAGLAPPPYGLEHKIFASGNLIAEALSADALDVGTMSDVPPIFIAAKKPLLRIVAVIEGDVANQQALVPRDSPIRKLADIRGKRIGYVRATTSHYILLKLLDEAGLSLDDVRPMALAPQDGRAAFERGDLDVWIAFGVVSFLAREATGARVLANGVGRLTGNYVIAANLRALEDPVRRAAVQDYVRRLAKLILWSERHPAEATRLLSEATGLDQKVYLAQRALRSQATSVVPVDEAAIKTQQEVADAFYRHRVIPQPIDVRPVWDTGFRF